MGEEGYTKCEKCGVIMEVGSYPFCPHGTGTNARGQDEIPGGMWIENLGPVPVKVYSHSERLAIMKSRGLVEFVRHTGVPGTDKSPHTTNWDVGPSKDGRPFCMLSPEEQTARRNEAAETLGVGIDQLEYIGRGGSLIIPPDIDPNSDAARITIEMSGERDGGEYARDNVKHFNVAADASDVIDFMESLKNVSNKR